MNKNKWQITLGVILIGLSIILYSIHYLIFKDSHHIFIFLMGDVAFVPFEVFLVSLIINRVLERKEKQEIQKKLSMLIGVFFSEAGNDLLVLTSNLDPQLDKIKKDFITKENWSEEEFQDFLKKVDNYDYSIKLEKESFRNLIEFLHCKRDFLIKLLQNPNLLEHETFTELLRSVFHLEEEFCRRMQFDSLSNENTAHLTEDVEKMYRSLVHTWVEYMKHLKMEYPSLFLFAMATNPFEEEHLSEKRVNCPT